MMTLGKQLLDRIFAVLARRLSTAEKSDEVSPDDQTGDGVLPWVLCIDDDPDFSRALQFRLESHGVAVQRAFDGTQGVRAAFTTSASAIILDYGLPNGQGDYVLRRLKENPFTCDIPVIMVTGITDRAIQRKLINQGAATLLRKPLVFSDLRNELSRYIDILRVVVPNADAPTCKLVC